MKTTSPASSRPACGPATAGIQASQITEPSTTTRPNGAAAAPRVAADAPALVLTPAEQAIADLLPQGWTNKEIARQLGKSDETIKCQLKALMRRARARNRTELAHLVSSMPSGAQSMTDLK